MKRIKVDAKDEETDSGERIKTNDSEAVKRQELQQKMLVYQILQKHMEELQQQAMQLEKRYVEFDITQQVLSDVGKMKDNGEVMFPLGSGVFAKGTVTDAKTVMVELGAGYLLKKDPESTNKLLEEKKKDIESSSVSLKKELEATAAKMNTIASELQQSSQM